MSILAGYISKKGRFSTNLIEDKIESFSCITNDDIDLYKYHVIPTKFGHIILGHKTDYPIKYEPLKDHYGNVLAVLGFFCFSNLVKSFNNLFVQCVEDSPKIIENLEGEFLSVFAESRSGRIHLINDRFASRPCYILKTDTCFYFSSNLAFLFSLASGKRSIDIEGLLQMFTYGHTIGEKTIFANIARLIPAGHAIIEQGHMHLNNYWPLEHIPEEKLNPKEYAIEVFNCFKKGVEYRAKLVEKGVIALSGGLDSRLIAYCLPDKHKYTAFTFIDSSLNSNTIEVNTAREVSKILDIKHHVELIPVGSASTKVKDMIYLTGGLISLTHTVKVMCYIDYIKKFGFKYLLGGGPGDVLAGSKIPKSPICVSSENIDEGIKLFFLNYTPVNDVKTYLSNIIKRDIIEEYYPFVENSFFNSIEKLKGTTAAHKITAWSLLNRWPGFTFTTPLHNHPDITESFCHLSYRYCELMLRIPAEWLYGQNFYNYMIYENLIGLRDVIYANTGKKLSGEIYNYQWIPPSYLYSLKKKLLASIKKTNTGMKLVSSVKNFKTTFLPSQTPKLKPPGFLYTIFKEDKKLFLDLDEILNTISDLKYILDISKSNNFLKMYRNGEPVTNSLDNDTDLLGKLSAFCYSFKHLNYK